MSKLTEYQEKMFMFMVSYIPQADIIEHNSHNGFVIFKRFSHECAMVVSDITTNTIKLYINGVVVDTKTFDSHEDLVNKTLSLNGINTYLLTLPSLNIEENLGNDYWDGD